MLVINNTMQSLQICKSLLALLSKVVHIVLQPSEIAKP